LNGIAVLTIYLTAPYPGAWFGGDVQIILNGIAVLTIYLTAPYPGAWFGGDV